VVRGPGGCGGGDRVQGDSQRRRRSPRGRNGIGAAAVNADPASKQVSWRVEYTDLGSPAIAAEIICAAEVGVRGAGIAVALGNAPDMKSPLTGIGTMTDAQFADLAAGRCYVRIDTVAHKGGEIRGPLKR
jgi:hypothetical protein